MTIILVSCVSQKLTRPAPARELYTSDWFKKAANYAELQVAKGHAVSWRILSAKHSILDPRQTIDPYNVAMYTLTLHQRIQWAFNLANALPFGYDYEVLAGCAYTEYLLPMLRAKDCNVYTPMAGMSIGQQKQWLKRQAQSPSLTKGQ